MFASLFFKIFRNIHCCNNIKNMQLNRVKKQPKINIIFSELIMKQQGNEKVGEYVLRKQKSILN